MSISIHTACLTLAMAAVAAVPGWPQRTGSNWPSPPPSAQQMPTGVRPKTTNLEQLQKAAERHKIQVQKDTDRLSQLIDELKQELDNTPAGTLSVGALKKSKQIEKLAKRVRKEIAH